MCNDCSAWCLLKNAKHRESHHVSIAAYHPQQLGIILAVNIASWSPSKPSRGLLWSPPKAATAPTWAILADKLYNRLPDKPTYTSIHHCYYRYCCWLLNGYQPPPTNQSADQPTTRSSELLGPLAPGKASCNQVEFRLDSKQVSRLGVSPE